VARGKKELEGVVVRTVRKAVGSIKGKPVNIDADPRAVALWRARLRRGK